MDLFFEAGKGRTFSMEVGYFDTVLEIKEKIQKKYGIPVAKQTLIYHGQILPDDLNVHYSDILDRSKLQLHITHESPDAKPTFEQEKSPKKIQDLLNLAVASKGSVDVQMVHANGIELFHQRSLRDCQISEQSEVQVEVKSSPTTNSWGSTGNVQMDPQKLRVTVLTKCGTKKVTVEVNAGDNVGVMRKELEKLKKRIHFHLPEEGYFFIHKQNMMDDDRSFRWHHVCQGDTIEIFNGSVTGGS